MSLETLARRCHVILRRSPELFSDVKRQKQDFDQLDDQNLSAWLAYWRKNPITAWTTQTPGKRKVYFRVEDERFIPELPIAEGTEEAFSRMTRELVDYRLAQYRARRRGEAAGSRYQIKRVVRQRRGWLLRSDNPAAPSYEASAETVPIAVLVHVVRPEDIAPPVGTVIDEGGIGAAFGVDDVTRTARVDGHLFLVVKKKGAFEAPDRLRSSVRRLPGETGFVLAAMADEPGWRYCGVARFREEEGLWSLPELDYTTWRALGAGRSCSRRLDPQDLDAARALVDRVEAQVGVGGWLDARGKRCRIAGRATNGGLRVDGGPKGFRERTVSLTDIAWVLGAARDVEQSGGILDEARVNRLRYLEGTPRGSTRWIDTGWALVIFETKRSEPPS